MSKPRRPQAYRLSEEPPTDASVADQVADAQANPEAGLDAGAEMAQTLELREEQLVAHNDLRDRGEIEVRTEVDEVPGRLEVDAYREEVVVEHETVGQVVNERDKPWEEDGVLVIPIYEEQLVVTKRLVLRERVRVRSVGVTERQLYQDTLRRERLMVEDPQHTGLVREQYPVSAPENGEANEDRGSSKGAEPDGGVLGNLVRKALE